MPTRRAATFCAPEPVYGASLFWVAVVLQCGARGLVLGPVPVAPPVLLGVVSGEGHSRAGPWLRTAGRQGRLI
eukprot:8515-Pelagomonas_calceolata.AAC.8